MGRKEYLEFTVFCTIVVLSLWVYKLGLAVLCRFL